jgi:hypothetical protein
MGGKPLRYCFSNLGAPRATSVPFAVLRLSELARCARGLWKMSIGLERPILVLVNKWCLEWSAGETTQLAVRIRTELYTHRLY